MAQLVKLLQTKDQDALSPQQTCHSQISEALATLRQSMAADVGAVPDKLAALRTQ